ncbi:MAG: hypothetical protein LBJ10_05050 [Clostridiales bacterium]|jgi:hypothetical protein|nr:hypothetical protein [Clostridiales bacterium]
MRETDAIILCASCAAAAAAFLAISSFVAVSGAGGGRLLKKLRRGGARAAGTGDGRHAGAGAYAGAGARQAIKTGRLHRAIARMVRLSPGRRDSVARKLKRAGFRCSAEEFYADAVIDAARLVLLAPLLALANIGIGALAALALGASLYCRKLGAPDERLRAMGGEIINELPRFVSVINYSMATDRDLIRTIEKYLKICKPAFRYDLELLLLEMKSRNNAEALKNFDERIGVPQLSSFVSGLIDADRGIDQRTFFYMVDENMKQLFIENMKRELGKRPAKIRKAIIAAGLCVFVLYLVPIGVQLVEGFDMFR